MQIFPLLLPSPNTKFRRRQSQSSACLAIFLVFTPAFGDCQSAVGLTLQSRITIPNVSGRMDHLGVDLKGHRLFATAFNNNTTEVIDVEIGQHVQTISHLATPQAALFDASMNHLFVSNSFDGSVVIFDGLTLEKLQTVKLSSDADNLRYDGATKTVVVGYGGEKFLHGHVARGEGHGALAFLDAAGRTTMEISLDAHPESFQLEKFGTRVFVNVPDHKEIQVGDVANPRRMHRWPIAGCTDNFPMALDEEDHRLFVGCRIPSLLVVFDTQTGRAVGRFPIVEHSDDLFYDTEMRRIYIIGQGSVEVWGQTDTDHYAKLGDAPTAVDARTGLFVPEWHKLFVAIPRHGASDAEVFVFRTN